MKKKYRVLYAICALFAMGTIASCSSEDSLRSESVLKTTPEVKTALDNWIDSQFLYTYNINVIYKYSQYKTDMDRYLTPAKVENVKPALEVIESIWLDTYRKVGGVLFVKQNAARELVLIGSKNLNENGTNTLGVAEAGWRISMFKVDDLNFKSESEVKEFIHTIQHEFVHILNQTAPYDPKYGLVTASDYMVDWQNGTTAEARKLGFISNYARTNVAEDFAEQASWMLRDIVAYRKIVDGLAAGAGKNNILTKEALVVEYYKTAFQIDFYELCDVALKHTKEVVAK